MQSAAPAQRQKGDETLKWEMAKARRLMAMQQPQQQLIALSKDSLQASPIRPGAADLSEAAACINTSGAGFAEGRRSGASSCV